MKSLLQLNLTLFDGGAAAGAAAAAATGGEGTTASNGVSSQQQQVLYGKQPQLEGQNAEGEEGKAEPSEQPKATLKDIISSDPNIKQELERMIQNRVKNSKNELEQATKRMQSLDPIMATLYTRYGVQEGDIEGLTKALNQDVSYLEEEAELKGMTVEQLAYIKQLEMQNMMAKKQQQLTQDQLYRQQLQKKWDNESAIVKQLYPDFDFVEEISNNETFEKLIRSNVPVKDAYEFAHREELDKARQAAVAAEMQKQVVSNIKARQERPIEAGLKGQQGFQIKADPSKLTSKDIKDIRKRVANGEKISF